MSLMTDAVAEALAKEVTRKVMYQLSGQWGAVLNELQKSAKIMESLKATVGQLGRGLAEQQQLTRKVLKEAEATIIMIRDNQVKAAETLRYAMADLGLTE